MNFYNDHSIQRLADVTIKGSLREVQRLVSQGINVNSFENNTRRTPLFLAVEGNHNHIVEYLLSHQADPNLGHFSGSTPLKAAAINGNMTIIRLLINTGAVVLPECLAAAARKGQLEVLKYLVENEGADINKRDITGDTALITAASYNHLEVVRYLVSQKAELNTKNYNHWNALDYACSGSSEKIVRYFIEIGANVNSEVLIRAVQGGDHEIIRLIASRVANVNAQTKRTGSVDDCNDSPLLVAVRKNDPAIVRYLLSQGADRQLTGLKGESALSIAKKNDFHEIIMILESLNDQETSV